jgi:cytochrome P450
MTERGVPIELPTRRSGHFDPPAELATLREQQPVCPLRFADGHVGWIVTSYELGRKVLMDPRFSVSPPRLVVGELLTSDVATPGVVIGLDPPDHTRVRRLQTAYFTLRRVSELRPALERIVAERIDTMKASGSPADLVREFALPFPSLAICEVLGIPHEERPRFEVPHDAAFDPAHSDAERNEAWTEFQRFAADVAQRKRTCPGDDLLSEVVATGELSDEELIGVVEQLVSAGHHTTASQLALSTFFLLADRARWEGLQAALAEDPAAIEPAVEELLRYLTLLQIGAFTRTALEDVELDETVIRTGESVSVSLAAANRDAGRFPEADRFDPARDASGHLSFGYGRHMCLGQHLARLELQVGLLGLLQFFPDLSLAIPADEVRLHPGEHVIHGVYELPVTW